MENQIKEETVDFSFLMNVKIIFERSEFIVSLYI